MVKGARVTETLGVAIVTVSASIEVEVGSETGQGATVIVVIETGRG